MVHGKPRHSQSQGSVEKGNRDVEDMLVAWMEDNNCTKWSEGLRFCQFQKNNSFHSGIKQSPFEAMFGRRATVGLASSSISEEITKTLSSEEDLEEHSAAMTNCEENLIAEEQLIVDAAEGNS